MRRFTFAVFLALWGLIVCPGMGWGYNFYFGNLHAHSAYSDGNMGNDPDYPSAYEAFIYARDVAGLDFLAITDHNHQEAGMRLSSFSAGRSDADDANGNGFVAIYGTEWGTLNDGQSNGGGGHVILLDPPVLFGWETGNYDVYVEKGDYIGLFEAYLDNPGSYGPVALLAHPENDDFDGYFNAYNAESERVVRLVSVKSGPAFSQDENMTDPASGDDEMRYQDALKRGYHASPTADQDNHYANWGTSNEQRTVVIAESATRQSILNALQAGRCYASEDANIEVTFQINNAWMGSQISVSTPSVPLTVSISDNEGGANIEIHHGIAGSGTAATLLTSKYNATSLSTNVSVGDGKTHYFYARLIQSDGQKVWTSPIWVTYKANEGENDDDDPQTGCAQTQKRQGIYTFSAFFPCFGMFYFLRRYRYF